jgi:hypothetical protein
MKRIENILSTTLAGNKTSSFIFPSKKEKKIVGLLLSPNLSVSLSLNGGAELVLDSLEANASVDVSPKSRFIPLDADLSMIRAKVENKSNDSRKVNVYLITE